MRREIYFFIFCILTIASTAVDYRDVALTGSSGAAQNYQEINLVAGSEPAVIPDLYNITIFSPENNSVFSISTIDLNWTINGTNMDSCWYNLNGGSDTVFDYDYFTGDVINTTQNAFDGKIRGITINESIIWLTEQASDVDKFSAWLTNGTRIALINNSDVSLSGDFQDLTYMPSGYFWVVTNTFASPNNVCKYYTNGTKEGTCVDFAASHSEFQANGISNNGTHFFVTGKTNSKVYIYSDAGVYDSELSVASPFGTPEGIAVVDDGFWVVLGLNKMSKFDFSGNLLAEEPSAFAGYNSVYFIAGNSSDTDIIYGNKDGGSSDTANNKPVIKFNMSKKNFENATISGFKVGINNITITCNDTSGIEVTSSPTYFNYTISLGITLEGFDSNISVELNNSVDIFVNSSEEIICINVDRPGIGDGFPTLQDSTGLLGAGPTCRAVPRTFILNWTYNYNQKFNSSENITLSYDSGIAQNITLSLDGLHKYSEIINSTFDLDSVTGNTTPLDVKVYINDTLSNDVGDLIPGTFSVTKFNEKTPPSNLTYNTSSIQTLTVSLPKSATVTGANLTLEGFYEGGDCYQESANVAESCGAFSTGYYSSEPNYVYITYIKPSEANKTLSRWGVSIGQKPDLSVLGTVNYTIPESCWDYDSSELKFRLYSEAEIAGSGNSLAYGQCFNGSWINITTIFSGTGASPGFVLGGNVNLVYDERYNLGSFYNTLTAGWKEFMDVAHNGTLYEEAMYWVYSQEVPTDSYLEVGSIDGTREWSVNGSFNGINITEDFSSAINSYLLTCSDPCNVPFYFGSGSRGNIEITNFSLEYTFNWNPVVLNQSLLNSYLDNSIGFTSIPIIIETTSNALINVTNISTSYLGGNSTVDIFVSDLNNLTNVTKRITYHDSEFSYSLPPGIDYFEFIPDTPTSKLVAPKGQNENIGILNITSINYGQPHDFYLYLNETGPFDSCVNLSYGLNSNSSNATLLTEGWQEAIEDVQLLDSDMIWLWANLSCTSTTWRWWRPIFDGRGCCLNCTGCLEVE